MLPGCREGVSPQGRTHVSGDKRKVMFGYPSWHTLLCGDDAHTTGIWIVVGKVCKLCRVKSIRIAASAVMDGLQRPTLTWASFFFKGCERKCVGGTGRVRESG